MATVTAHPSGSSNYTIRLILNQSGSTTNLTGSLVVYGTGSIYQYGAQPWSISVGGTVRASGSWVIGDWGGGYREYTLWSGSISVGAFGSFSMSATVAFNVYGGGLSIGSATASGTVGIANPATVPPAPKNLGVSLLTPTSFRFAFQSQGTGGSPIIRWEAGISLAEHFPGGGTSIYSTGGTYDFTGLDPNTTYYVAGRGVNAIGTGAWSPRVQVRTYRGVRGRASDADPWKLIPVTSRPGVACPVLVRVGDSWERVT